MIQFDRESNYAESGALFGKGGSQMTQFNVEYVLENNLNTLSSQDLGLPKLTSKIT